MLEPMAMSRKAHIGDDDTDFNLDYWLQFTPQQRWEAIWQATLDWAQMKGILESELRLKRYIVCIKRG